jgi:hypothetical protein
MTTSKQTTATPKQQQQQLKTKNSNDLKNKTTATAKGITPTFAGLGALGMGSPGFCWLV